ncbi:MAG: diaminopimelate epimerase [Chloroflexota bacterium]
MPLSNREPIRDAAGRFEALAAIPFTKMSGSGNDFIVVDNRNGCFPEQNRAAVIQRLCRRRLSVGADGVVLIEQANSPDIHFRWRYYNADGSEGEMCGNGAMCAARFAYLQGIAPARCVFATPSGRVEAEVEPDSRRVHLRMVDPGPVVVRQAIAAAGRHVIIHAITVGVPHVVVIVENVEAFAPGAEFLAFGRDIRYHPAFPNGTNVNVIARIDGNTLRMRTYERGVEDETLACGTGAVASAVVASTLGLVASPVTVVTTSGLPLTVRFTAKGNRATNVYLGGEARVIATGVTGPDALAATGVVSQ